MGVSTCRLLRVDDSGKKQYTILYSMPLQMLLPYKVIVDIDRSIMNLLHVANTNSVTFIKILNHKQ